MDKLKTALKNKVDKAVVIVNGEKISEKEISYIDFQLRSQSIYGSVKKKDTISEAIEEYVILEDAKKTM